MKKLALIILLSSTSLFVHAQNKEIEAIAAYQMAEENFDAKDYEAALKNINTTKTILRTANSKILYLEVQVLEELSKANSEYLKDLQSAIHAFEQAPDIDQFSQEKRVEVAKVKILVKDRIKKAEAAKRKEIELWQKKHQAQDDFLKLFPKIGVSYTDFINHPYMLVYVLKSDKRAMAKGGKVDFNYRSDKFTDNKRNERSINAIETNEDGLVESYSVLIEVTSADTRKAIYDLFEIENEDTWSLENRDTGIEYFISAKVYTTGGRWKRNGKKTYIQYIIAHIKSLEKK